MRRSKAVNVLGRVDYHAEIDTNRKKTKLQLSAKKMLENERKEGKKAQLRRRKRRGTAFSRVSEKSCRGHSREESEEGVISRRAELCPGLFTTTSFRSPDN